MSSPSISSTIIMRGFPGIHRIIEPQHERHRRGIICIERLGGLPRFCDRKAARRLPSARSSILSIPAPNPGNPLAYAWMTPCTIRQLTSRMGRDAPRIPINRIPQNDMDNAGPT